MNSIGGTNESNLALKPEDTVLVRLGNNKYPEKDEMRKLCLHKNKQKITEKKL